MTDQPLMIDSLCEMAHRPFEWLMDSDFGPWKTAGLVLPVMVAQVLWLDVLFFLILAAFVVDAHRKRKAKA